MVWGGYHVVDAAPDAQIWREGPAMLYLLVVGAIYSLVDHVVASRQYDRPTDCEGVYHPVIV